MARNSRSFIANQVFVGIPWKTIKPKYEKIITSLEEKYALHFVIVGRNDGQEAVQLFEFIKDKIASSSWAIFDVTGGNPNVSLEYGYAEGLGIEKAIYLSNHKASHRSGPLSPIISDLGGSRRVQYTNENSLQKRLEEFTKAHPFTKRFDKAMSGRGVTQLKKTIAVSVIRQLDGRELVRRDEILQNVQSINTRSFTAPTIDTIIKKLHAKQIINCSVGKSSKVRIV